MSEIAPNEATDEKKTGWLNTIKKTMNKDDKEDGESTPPGTVCGVWSYSSGLDRFMSCFGAILFALNGLLMPIFILIFGELINTIGGANPSADLDKYTILMVLLGAVAFVLCFSGTTLLDLSAERQIRAFRVDFISAIMGQEMAYYDKHDSGTFATRLNQYALTLRDGVGSKFGQMCMFTGLFLGGYTVGFLKSWELTLVLTARATRATSR
eukprot:Selendium_serpulae@DN6374_c0_g1_i1.p1